MTGITFRRHDGSETCVDLAAGQSLMELAKANDIEGIEAVCGGNCYCGTCRVVVDPAWRDRVGGTNPSEADMIESTVGSIPGSRLSCQVQVTAELDGLIVEVPEQQC